MAESKELRGFKLPSECVDNCVDGGRSKVTEHELEEKGKLQFQESLRSVSELNHPRSISRFHPTLPVLACGVNGKVILFSAADGSIAFSHWQESRVKLGKRQTLTEFSYFAAIEWNVDGTLLAAGDDDGGVVVWNYPEGAILFEAKKHTALSVIGNIQWNPFRHDVLSTWNIYEKKLLLWNSSSERNLFYEFEYEIEIRGVAWISETQIALSFESGLIEIYEIDEGQPTAKTRVVQRLQHDSGVTWGGIQWSDKTQHLATCSRDGSIKIWVMASDQPIHSLECPSSGCWLGCFAMLISRSGKSDNDSELPENFTLACGLEDGSIAIWSPLTKSEQSRHRILNFGPENEVVVDSLSFSPDGRLLASLVGDEDGNQLIIWSTTTWMPVFANRIHVYYPFWLSWLTTKLQSGVYYKLAVPQYVKHQDEVFVVELMPTGSNVHHSHS
ncbi:F-box-like/WD repeat-containing protein TBL1XR1 [Daphnia pulicaria]|uniref:F-box-like/WD repeat-containing protein TBL1XR1 n=1 Tax=Daphnia pulicaria TaxID=35523 RepID=UPI001EEBA3F1|nr:F-box-like/WD repeat-containing protein TBL1XR1 [Daphnia pulicaria]